MAQDASQIKERIISFISLNGPSLPVHVARDTGLSILFASAFLSELFNEKRVKISNLKVGSSPLYFIPGQEARLEEFSRFLKSREKDAFLLLKEKRIIKENDQHPAIRVALKEIKDFAIPLKKDDEIYWKYFLASENEINENDSVKKEEPRIIEKEEEKENHEEKPEKKEKIPKPKPVKKTGKAKGKKKDENFFNKIKEFLDKRNIEILDIKDFKDNEAVLKIKKEEEELLFVFNIKKIGEKELLRAYKKASETGMKYRILALGEPPKKLREMINAVKSLSSIDRID